MRIILGVTGSIAAKLTPRLVRELKRNGHEVIVVATPRGAFFFDPDKVEVKVMGDKDEWSEGGYHKNDPVPHIDLGDWADLLLVAPLTAETLADMAMGSGSKFLTCIVLAWPREKPIILAPAMNTKMWENPAVQRNLQTVIKDYQPTMVGPVEGELACGTCGMGAMASIKDIIAACQEAK